MIGGIIIGWVRDAYDWLIGAKELERQAGINVERVGGSDEVLFVRGSDSTPCERLGFPTRFARSMSKIYSGSDETRDVDYQ